MRQYLLRAWEALTPPALANQHLAAEDGRGQLPRWDTVLLHGTAVYIAMFALWQITRWGGSRYQPVIGDLAPMPVHLVLQFLTLTLARRFPPRSRHRRAWLLITWSAVATFLGDTIWGIYELLGRSPFPSWADAAYLAYYPLLIAGVLLLARGSMLRSRQSRITLDALTVMLGTALVVWYAVLRPVAQQHAPGRLNALLALAYPVADLAVLFGVIWVLLHRPAGVRLRALGLLAGGIAVFATADLAFARQSLARTYDSGDWPDLIWLVAWWLMAAGVSVQLRQPLSVSRHRQRNALDQLWPLRLLPYAVVMAVYAVTLMVALGEASRGLRGLLAGAATLTAIVVARQMLVLRENDRLLLRAAALNRRMREREAQYRQMATNASDLLYVLRPTSDALTWYGRIDELLGYPTGGGPRTVTAWEAHLHPDDRAHVLERFEHSTKTGEPFRTEYRIRRADGTYLIWDDRGTPVYNRDGTLVRFVGACTDVTERHEAEAALAGSEARFRLLVQSSSDLLVVLDVAGVVRYAGPSSLPLLGVPPEEMVGTRMASWLHPEDVTAMAQLFRRRIEEPDAPQMGGSIRLRHHDGSWRHMDGLATNLLGEPAVQGIVVNMRDVTERQDFERRLAYQAFHDALTGLPNRALFVDRLEHALALRGRRAEQVGVLFLDLDGFKLINDSLGHSAGDALLVQVSERLAAVLREGDTVARFGGDEFAILLEDIGEPVAALDIADRVLATFDQPFAISDRVVSVSTSIGISLSGETEATPDELLRTADIALYQAKAAGKGRAMRYDASMQAGTLARLDLQAELRSALQHNEFELHYQPELDLHTGALVGMEALIRWRHPRRGLLLPGAFVAIAEETGLILPIGEWALREACRQARVWQDLLGGAAPRTVSVNLSARQFEQPELVDMVQRVLRETGLNPGALCLEITESMAMVQIDASIAVCHALKRLGVQVAIDDFGTGYSSLSYLRRFPADVLKIDRAFVAELAEGDDTEAIVRAITTLAHALNMRVTAEGIESAGQAALLARLACNTGQGYQFSPPLTVAAFAQYMARPATLAPLRPTA